MSSPHPSGPRTQRFQLPVRAPLRALLVACLSATVGSLEIMVWATFGLPRFVAQAGVVLVVLGLGIGAWCLIQGRAVRWTLYLGPDSLVISRGSRRQQLPWTEIRAVQVNGSRLAIHRFGHRSPQTLPIGPGAHGSSTLTEMLAAINARLAARPEVSPGPG